MFLLVFHGILDRNTILPKISYTLISVIFPTHFRASRLVEPCLGSNMVVCAGPMANWYDIYLAGVLAVRDYVCGEGLDSKFIDLQGNY